MALGRIVLAVVMSGVLAMGGAAFVTGSQLLLGGTPNVAGAVTAVLMGLVLTGVAIAYFYGAFVRGPAVQARQDSIHARYPGQPWMLREDWASRKLTSSTGGIAWFMWIWTAGWWSFLILIGTVNREKILKAIGESWWNLALLAVFVGAGLIGLFVAVEFTRRSKRYGVSTLQLESLPLFIGEPFAATFTARLGPAQRSPLEVVLACDDVEWVTTGHNSNRRTRLVVTPISLTSSSVDPRTFTPSKEGLRGRLSVDIPASLPPYSRDANGDGVRWTLRIATTGNDEPFSCEFEIPVFERSQERR